MHILRAASGLPANIQFFLPIARGRIQFSTRLLLIFYSAVMQEPSQFVTIGSGSIGIALPIELFGRTLRISVSSHI